MFRLSTPITAARFLSRGIASKSLVAPLSVRGLATVTDAPAGYYNNHPPSAPSGYTSSSKAAALKLKSGEVFRGTSFGANTSAFGETVFTTSVVGYPESMTDPSYRGQILVFTQPLVGNYGVPGQFRDMYGLLQRFESDRIQCQAIVVNDYATRYSHWTAVESLGEWCSRHNVPAVSGVDTRAIVHLLRDNGSTLGKISVGDDALTDDVAQEEFPDPNNRNLVSEVSTRVPLSYNPYGDIKLGVVDCGVKQNILRSLVEQGAAVTVLPWDFDFNKVADQFDGLFISNGPGSPVKCDKTVSHLKTALATFNKPIFGICMGNLLMGMAAGLKPYKLPFGNRGHNVPALNLTNGKCYITSQNHGYALDDQQMPEGWERYFVNANDGSNEGIKHKTLPISSVQFHPEAMGGPQDTQYLFTTFLAQVRASKAAREGLPVYVPEIQQLPNAVSAFA